MCSMYLPTPSTSQPQARTDMVMSPPGHHCCSVPVILAMSHRHMSASVRFVKLTSAVTNTLIFFCIVQGACKQLSDTICKLRSHWAAPQPTLAISELLTVTQNDFMHWQLYSQGPCCNLCHVLAAARFLMNQLIFPVIHSGWL